MTTPTAKKVPAAKTAAPRKTRTAAKAPLKASAPAPMVEDIPETSSPAAPLPGDVVADALKPATRLNDLMERVAANLGLKKKNVRDILTQTLSEIGAALDRGEALNLPPLGKIKINRSQTVASGTAMTLKLRRGAGGPSAAKVGLVEADEAS